MSFAADAAAIFDGPLAVDAIYTAAGGGDVAIRVLPDLGDAEAGFTEFAVSSEAAIFHVLVSEIPAPAAGDVLVIDGDTYTVQGVPRRDARRLRWRLEARPA